jgi:hypothetical protein
MVFEGPTRLRKKSALELRIKYSRASNQKSQSAKIFEFGFSGFRWLGTAQIINSDRAGAKARGPSSHDTV